MSISLGETLTLALPVLPAASIASPANAITGTGPSLGLGTGISDLGIWADEEDKKFYEELIDLRDEVPVMLLGLDAPDKKEDQEEQMETSNDDQATLEVEMEKLAVKHLSVVSDEQPEAEDEAEPDEFSHNFSVYPSSRPCL